MSIDIRPDNYHIDWDSPLNLNMANGNAVRVLAILGLTEMEGMIHPADLKARVLMARLADDTGEPDAVDNRTRMVHCGIRPGYYADRLDSLDTIADYALAHGLMVVWY